MTTMPLTKPKHPIIVLWAHPRSMSTALERVMRERGDCTCLHEPFMYYYYVHLARKTMPGFHIEAERPTTFEAITAMLFKEAEAKMVFSKDMGYYVLPEITKWSDLATAITHVMLIRDPRKSILSYFKLDPDLQCEEIGLESQWRLYQWIEERSRIPPLVVEAEHIQQNPETEIARLWRKIGISHMPHAFNWDANKTPSDWRQVGLWHAKTQAEDSIRTDTSTEAEIQRSFDEAAGKRPALKNYLDHHWPFYLKLRDRARS